MMFRVLRGLYGEGPSPKQFTYGDKRTHSEGVVVEFSSPDSALWVGNFQRAIGSYSGALTHPNTHDVIVVAGGQGYVVNPLTSQLKATFGGVVQGLWTTADSRLVVVDDSGIRFSALDEHGWRWHTKRLSWDGFEDVRIVSKSLVCQSWNAIDQVCRPFRIDLATGIVEGGAHVDVGDQVI